MTGLCGPACHSSSPMVPHGEGESQGFPGFIFFLCCCSKCLHVTETLEYVYMYAHAYCSCARNIAKNKFSLAFLLILFLSITFLCQLQLISMTNEASCSHRSLTPGSGSSGKNNHQHMDTVTVHYPQCTMTVNTHCSD